MTLTHQDKERIALEYGYTIVCWHPLEMEDSTGEIIREHAEHLLTRLVLAYVADHPEYDDEAAVSSEPVLDDEVEAIREFHQKFGFLDSGHTPTMLTKRKLTERAECMQEELDEFKNAIQSQDFAEQADALIDLVYFAKGTAVMMGLPWKQLFNDVQRANISKVRGVTKRGHAFDVIKPEGWQKPNGAAILTAAGFDQSKFETGGVVDESKCLDDQRKVFHIDLEDADTAAAAKIIKKAMGTI